jgi:hypothetical protein
MSDEQFKRDFKKENKKVISVVFSPEHLKKLEEGNYNKSKLINHLLNEHFKQEDKK